MDRCIYRYSTGLFDIQIWTFYSIEDELAENTDRIIPYFSITFTILCTFSITACTLFDPVRTKPWLGLCGVISAGLAIGTAFGVLMYAGMPFVDLVAAAPFLAVGIGVDDMFVMLAAWRKTDHYLDTEERMAESFSDAAMSITITSITDILAVGIGAITLFPSVRIFCIYTTLTLALDFVFQITFFAGCMVLFGKLEWAQIGAWTCKEVPSKSETVDRSKVFMMCCAGGVSRQNTESRTSEDRMRHPDDNTDVMMMVFFRDNFGKFITKTVSKIVILVLWAVYIGIAIWGCIELKQGLQLKNLAPDDSYVVSFYEQEELHFTKYPFSVQIVVHSLIDSTEKANEVERLLTGFESSPYFQGATFTESWLRDYKTYSKAKNYSISYDNLFTNFFDIFLQEPAYAKYEQDIVKVQTTNKIFRFLVMAKDLFDTTVEREMMIEARRIALDFPDLDVTVFSPRFIITEQYVAVLPNTLQNLGIATCSMIAVALLLIPHPLVCFWVTLSIVSICVGVIGYMSFWGVHLDSVSMVNLIMCIGFCVDFSAHITYAFVTSKKEERSDRVRDSLYGLGMPILQGSVSTILAVSVLAVSNAYIFRTFFKIMFLVILFGTLHGLFLLPVLLSLVGPKGRTNKVVPKL